MGWWDAATSAFDIFGAWYDNRMNEKNAHEQMDFDQEQARLNREFQSDQAAKDRDMARDFAENGISMRVQDAINAGLHPLVGAGATPLNYSPIGVGGDSARSPGVPASEMGQNIARALRAAKTKEDREREMFQLALLRSQVDENDARTAYYDSLSFKALQEGLQTKPIGEGKAAGWQINIPDRRVSSDPQDPTRTAGKPHPFWKRVSMFEGLPGIDVPYYEGEASEALEGMANIGLSIARNLIDRPYRWAYRVGQKTREKWFKDLKGGGFNYGH